jgi:hypothetical protein
LNGAHQLLVYADDVNLLADNTNTKKKNTKFVIGVSKEVGLEVKTKYMLIFRHRGAGQNHSMKTANRSFEMCQGFNIWER